MFPLSRSNFILHTSEKPDQKYINQLKIGEGSFGTVFSSLLKETSEQRAIKHIDKSLIKHPERLQSEISTMLECDHPNIIKLYEIFEDKKNLYLVMEQCSGGELFDYIINNTKIGEMEAAGLFRQIMLAVHYLHTKNIVHRDLKPENLMFSGPGTLKLIDFGIAKALDDGQEMNTRAGTVSFKQPFYMSPEILKGNYGISTDVWSAGVVLYTMLCGYPPFYGNSDLEIFKKVLTGNFSFRGAEWRNVSNSAKDLIRNMLIVNTEMRYNSKQVLEHPWLSQSLLKPSISIPQSQIDSYINSSSFTKTVLLSIIVHSDDKSLTDAKEAFISLDQEGSGQLSKESIEFYLGLKFPSTSQTLKRFIESMDLNQNGLIDYSEFLSAFVEPSQILTKPRLSQSFQLFDRNKNGKISSDDLQKLLDRRSKKNLPVFKNMLLEINCKSPSGLNIEEFYEAVTKNVF